jgi:predicted AAA+ superfamily ATPase
MRKTETESVVLLQQHLKAVKPPTILGALQVGRPTLALEILRDAKAPDERFDLEDPADLARLAEPKLALASRKGLVVIDEIQRQPDLFPVLRMFATGQLRRTRSASRASCSSESNVSRQTRVAAASSGTARPNASTTRSPS